MEPESREQKLAAARERLAQMKANTNATGTQLSGSNKEGFQGSAVLKIMLTPFVDNLAFLDLDDSDFDEPTPEEIRKSFLAEQAAKAAAKSPSHGDDDEDLRKGELTRQIAEQESTIEAQRNEIEKLRFHIEEREKEIASLKADYDALETEAKSKDEQIIELTNECSRVSLNCDGLKSRLEKLSVQGLNGLSPDIDPSQSNEINWVLTEHVIESPKVKAATLSNKETALSEKPVSSRDFASDSIHLSEDECQIVNMEGDENRCDKNAGTSQGNCCQSSSVPLDVEATLEPKHQTPSEVEVKSDMDEISTDSRAPVLSGVDLDTHANLDKMSNAEDVHIDAISVPISLLHDDAKILKETRSNSISDESVPMVSSNIESSGGDFWENLVGSKVSHQVQDLIQSNENDLKVSNRSISPGANLNEVVASEPSAIAHGATSDCEDTTVEALVRPISDLNSASIEGPKDAIRQRDTEDENGLKELPHSLIQKKDMAKSSSKAALLLNESSCNLIGDLPKDNPNDVTIDNLDEISLEESDERMTADTAIPSDARMAEVAQLVENRLVDERDGPLKSESEFNPRVNEDHFHVSKEAGSENGGTQYSQVGTNESGATEVASVESSMVNVTTNLSGPQINDAETGTNAEHSLTGIAKESAWPVKANYETAEVSTTDKQEDLALLEDNGSSQMAPIKPSLVACSVTHPQTHDGNAQTTEDHLHPSDEPPHNESARGKDSQHVLPNADDQMVSASENEYLPQGAYTHSGNAGDFRLLLLKWKDWQVDMRPWIHASKVSL